MLHLPLSFFGSYTQETRLMLDAYAGFLDRLKEAGTQEGPCFLTIKLVLLLSTAVEQRCKRIGIGLENL